MDSEHLPKSPVFPTEIIELIIDHLQDDIVALTRISGTSHAIHHSCHRRLFRSVKLVISPTPKMFIRVFRHNPSIGQHVRKLVLHIHPRLSEWVPGKQNTQDLAAVHENIQTLTQTPFVEKLSIRGSITSWNSLHATLQQPILNCIHSASLTELSIEAFVIPVTIFRSCVNLSALMINYVEDSGKPEPNDQARMSPHSPQPMNIPQLRSFEVVSSTAFALALLRYRDSDGHPLIRFDRLETLIVPYYHPKQEMQVIEDICKEATGLETFACGGIMAGTESTDWPDFSHFLMLKNWRGQGKLFSESLLQGLCEKLQMFPQLNVLETLDLEISLPEGWHYLPISIQNEWGQLDVVLSRGFPRLHTVSINVVLFYSPPADPDSESAELRESERLFREKFPCLNGNPAVNFNFSTSFWD